MNVDRCSWHVQYYTTPIALTATTLGELHPFKYLTTRVFLFVARELVPSKLPGDEVHAIAEHRVALSGFIDPCRSGELRDANAIAGLCLARDYLRRLTPHASGV